MSVKSHSAHLAAVARFVDRFADRFDPAGLAAKQRLSAAAEIDRLILLFNGQSAELETALIRLRNRLRTAPSASAIAAARPRPAHRGLALLLRLLPPLATAAAVASATIAAPAVAAIPVVRVGESDRQPADPGQRDRRQHQRDARLCGPHLQQQHHPVGEDGRRHLHRLERQGADGHRDQHDQRRQPRGGLRHRPDAEGRQQRRHQRRHVVTNARPPTRSSAAMARAAPP